MGNPVLVVSAGSILRLVVTDKDRHPLCERGRTATVVSVTYRADGRVQAYTVRLHCTTGKEPLKFGTTKCQYIPILNRNVGVLSLSVEFPKSYFEVVREQATIR